MYLCLSQNSTNLSYIFRAFLVSSRQKLLFDPLTRNEKEKKKTDQQREDAYFHRCAKRQQPRFRIISRSTVAIDFPRRDTRDQL